MLLPALCNLSIALKHYTLYASNPVKTQLKLPKLPKLQTTDSHAPSGIKSAQSLTGACQVVATRGDSLKRTLRDDEILDAIRDFSSNGASGKLQVTTGVTEGAVFFDKGHIVDASLGKLTGFQAINAMAGIRDATVSFDPSSTPPLQTLTPSERMLLNDFFGMRVRREPEYFVGASGSTDSEPRQVVPLGDMKVEENSKPDAQQTKRTPHLETPQLAEQSFVDAGAATFDATPLTHPESSDSVPFSYEEESIPENVDEVTQITSTAHRKDEQPAISYERVSRRRFLPALFVTATAILFLVVAASVIYRSHER
ncbi:MAG: hypothetical protein DMF69_24840, partial [Acidobacteria bacterium]